MNCTKCGKELPEGATYCAYCGTATTAAAHGVVEQSSSLRTLLNRTWEVIHNNIKTLILLEAIFFAPAVVWGVVFAGGLVSQQILENPVGTPISVLGIVVVYIALRLVVLFAQMYVVDSGTTSIQAALSYGLKRFLPAFGYVVFLMLLFIPFVLISIFPLVFGYRFLGVDPVMMGSIGAVVVPMLITAYVYLSIRLAFTVPLAVLHGATGSKIKQSWELTRGRVWRILKSLVLIGIVSFIIQMPFQLLGPLAPDVIQGILGIVAQSAAQVFSLVYIILLMKDIQSE